MLWDRHFFEGHALYDEVWNFYGPLPHVFRYLLHQLGALPLTHDAYRLLTLLNWLGAASLLSFAVLRLTRSLPLAALAHWLVLLHLVPITGEPGHPQEYAALLLGATVVLAGRVGPGDRLGFAGLGVATAAMLLTKMNAGAFLALALGCSMALAARSGRLVRALRALSAAALVGLPPALMGSDAWSAGWGGMALAATVGSLLLFASALDGERERPIGLREAGWLAAAAAGGSALGVALPVLLGSSVHQLAYSILVLPSWFTKWFGARLSIPLPSPLLGVLGAAVYLAYRRARRGRSGRRRVAGARVLLGVLIVGLALGLPHPAGYGALCWTLPLLWLLLPSSDLEQSLSHWFPRLVLALTAVLESFTVYPVTGSQAAIGTLLIAICGLVSLSDGARELAMPPWVAGWRRVLARAFAGLLATTLVAGYAAEGSQAARLYWSRPSLALPGATWIHAREEQAAVYRWLALNVADHCDTFLAVPGLDSLYFWARKPAPSPASADRWFLSFDSVQKRAVMDALLSHPRPCFLLDWRSTSFWLKKKRDPNSVRPLLRRIERNFATQGRAGAWRFMTLRDPELAR